MRTVIFPFTTSLATAFGTALVALLPLVASPALAQGRPGLLPDFTELYERQGPAVVSIDVTQKAGPDGRLFGSVTNSDIAEGVTKATNIQVKKAEVRMPTGPLKHIGEFPIVLHLHADVEANIVVHVVAEA